MRSIEVGNSLIAASDGVQEPTDPPAHFFSRRKGRTTSPLEPRTSGATIPQPKTVASWAVLLVRDRSEINALAAYQRLLKKTPCYIPRVGQLGLVGIGFASRRTITQLLTRYAQSYVGLVEDAWSSVCNRGGSALLRRSSSTPSTLLKLNGTDLRQKPIEVRKATLANILRKTALPARRQRHPRPSLRCAPCFCHATAMRGCLRHRPYCAPKENRTGSSRTHRR
jgi:hypothetical protein